MSRLTLKDLAVLRSAKNNRRDTFLPWRGTFGRAERLAKSGLLKSAGTSVMPPYVLYVVTDAGLAALAEFDRA